MTSVPGRGEKAVVAAGGCARMVVAIAVSRVARVSIVALLVSLVVGAALLIGALMLIVRAALVVVTALIIRPILSRAILCGPLLGPVLRAGGRGS
jgi:hypothetical protein